MGFEDDGEVTARFTVRVRARVRDVRVSPNPNPHPNPNPNPYLDEDAPDVDVVSGCADLGHDGARAEEDDDEVDHGVGELAPDQVSK